MKALTPLCFLTVLMAMSSCAKEDLSASIDTIIFGHFYGKCVGEECIETYKLEQNKLFEDLLDRYAGGDHQNFAFSQLPDSLYDKMPDLFQSFPFQLIGKDNIFGMPDAGDWGGIYVQIRQKGKTYWWLIDKAEDDLPVWLLPFKHEIEAAIELLP